MRLCSAGCCRGAKWKLRASAAAASSSFYCGGEFAAFLFGSMCIFTKQMFISAILLFSNFVSVDLQMHFSLL